MNPYLNCEDWYCKECDEVVFLGEWEDVYLKPKYCSNCGSKLDDVWNIDVEEE